MKRLLIMRHAEAGHRNGADHDRELTERGRSQANQVGLWMRRRGWGVDAIVASTAVRTMQTGLLVRDALFADHASPEELHTDAKLYNCSSNTWSEVVAGFPNDWDDVLVIGHNPAVQEIVSLSAGQSIPITVGTVSDIRISDWAMLKSGSVVGVFLPDGQDLLAHTDDG